MNYSMIRYVLAWVVMIVGLFMALPAIIGLIYGEYTQAVKYLICCACCVAAGAVVRCFKPKNTEIYQREGYFIAGLAWVVMSLVAAIPLVWTGDMPKYIDALFEIVSGFTTTGVSAIPNIEVVSRASVFWRSLSHWLGGMGIIVFVLMLMPVRHGSSMNLMVAESPGPDVSKFVPHVRSTAVLLYKIYIVMTLVMVALLFISGMSMFDSWCITFGTAGTGGFATLSDSCMSYTAAQQWIITTFMFLFGTNFGFFYLIVSKKPAQAFKMEETRVYLGIIIVVVALVTINVYSMYGNFGDTFRHAAFNVGSIMSTTGFYSTNFNLWPMLSRSLLYLVMFTGACAGSTAGGIKISRIIILAKSVAAEIHSSIHPRSVKKIKMNGKVIGERQLRAVHVFFIAYIMIFALSVIVISVDNWDFETNFVAVASTLNNIGCGFGKIGPLGDSFADFSILYKIVLILDMLIGRLEVIPMLILLNPASWRKRG